MMMFFLKIENVKGASNQDSSGQFRKENILYLIIKLFLGLHQNSKFDDLRFSVTKFRIGNAANKEKVKYSVYEIDFSTKTLKINKWYNKTGAIKYQTLHK